MLSVRLVLRKFKGCGVASLVVLAGLLTCVTAMPQEAMSTQNGSGAQEPQRQDSAPVLRQPPADAAEDTAQGQDVGAGSNYDPAMFQRPMAKDQLAFLGQFAGQPSDTLYRDKQFRKLIKSFVPDCTFHYGSDKSLTDALDEVIKGSKEPVLIRQGRYVLLSGRMGPYLSGKGFLWIDMQEGIGLGGFYFHPTNGEPTPSVNLFSRQVQKEALLELSELPPAFVEDEIEWSRAERVPPLTTRYFLTGSNKKILLEHDEEYCSPAFSLRNEDCRQMDADASDIDVDAASYLEQTHHSTNATAWMITDAQQIAWVHVRDSTCGGLIDPLGCHVRMTRERTHVIAHAPPPRPVRPVGHPPIHR